MKRQFKGGLFLGLVPLILLYMGFMYRAGGLSPLLVLTLMVAVPCVGILALAGFRLLGSLPAWSAMLLGLVGVLFACGEKGTALLLWALCCGGPMAISFVWPKYPRIRALAMNTLPMAGVFWLGGSLLYTRWHFGSWALSAVTQRIGARYLEMVLQMEKIYQEIYPEGFPQQLQELFTIMKDQSLAVGFLMISMLAYLLFCSFFGCVWVADRIASPSPQKRWLGSWAKMIPTRGVSWVFLLAYFTAPFLKQKVQLPAMTVLNLLGFFYVFTTLYTLLQWMRKRGWHPALRGLLIGLGFFLAFVSVNGAVLSPYSLFLIFGLVIATTPASVQKFFK